MDKVLRAFIHSGSSFERSIHRRAQRGKGVGVEREKERQSRLRSDPPGYLWKRRTN